jgi:GNAT superfamily N-acetyltransferase
VISPVDIHYRWIDGWVASDKDWNRIAMALEARGWMSLNRKVSRILLAEAGDEMIGFLVFQAIPHCGPMFVDKAYRGEGVPEALSERMVEFLEESHCRGLLVVPSNPFSRAFCEKYGLKPVTLPVYLREQEF